MSLMRVIFQRNILHSLMIYFGARKSLLIFVIFIIYNYNLQLKELWGFFPSNNGIAKVIVNEIVNGIVVLCFIV